MARKKRARSSKATGLVSLESSVKKLTSMLTHPDASLWMYAGGAAGVRQKMLSINYDVLRSIVHRVPLINAIITARIDQVLPFCNRLVSRDAKGFEIVPLQPTKPGAKLKTTQQAEIDQLYTFFEQTGFKYDNDREDDLMDYAQILIRDVCTIDQVATEVQLNRLGKPAAFWALDGATVYRVDPSQSQYPKDVRFVQMIDQKVYNTYTAETLLFDYKNKRSDIRYRGFGYSYVEMAIDMITTLLFGYRYLQDQLVRDRVPKGFISVMGDADDEQLDALRRYWYAAMTGAGGQWNLPILPSGKDGVGVEFKNLATSNRDMEYHKLMMFISAILGAVFAIDLAEIGIKTDDSQAIIGDSGRPRIEASKDRGLGSLLAFLEQHLNKILRKVTDQYRLRFVGFDLPDEQKRVEVAAKRVATYMTPNEIREESGLPRLEDEYADVILNPQAVQMVNQQKQAEQAEQQQQAGGDEMAGGAPPDEGGDEEQPTDEDEGGQFDWQSMFKSRGELPEHVTITIGGKR